MGCLFSITRDGKDFEFYDRQRKHDFVIAKISMKLNNELKISSPRCYTFPVFIKIHRVWEQF